MTPYQEDVSVAECETVVEWDYLVLLDLIKDIFRDGCFEVLQKATPHILARFVADLWTSSRPSLKTWEHGDVLWNSDRKMHPDFEVPFYHSLDVLEEFDVFPREVHWYSFLRRFSNIQDASIWKEETS